MFNVPSLKQLGWFTTAGGAKNSLRVFGLRACHAGGFVDIFVMFHNLQE